MPLIEGACLEVLELTEFVTMVTSGPDGPHITATWGDYIRQLGIEDDRLLAPVGYLHHMEENLAKDSHIQLLAASRSVQGKLGPGQGFTLKGTGRIAASGEEVERAKALFPWARGVLIVEVEEAIAHL